MLNYDASELSVDIIFSLHGTHRLCFSISLLFLIFFTRCGLEQCDALCCGGHAFCFSHQACCRAPWACQERCFSSALSVPLLLPFSSNLLTFPPCIHLFHILFLATLFRFSAHFFYKLHSTFGFIHSVKNLILSRLFLTLTDRRNWIICVGSSPESRWRHSPSRFTLQCCCGDRWLLCITHGSRDCWARETRWGTSILRMIANFRIIFWDPLRIFTHLEYRTLKWKRKKVNSRSSSCQKRNVCDLNLILRCPTWQ